MKWIIKIVHSLTGIPYSPPMYFECMVCHPAPSYPRATYHINKAKIFDNKKLARKQLSAFIAKEYGPIVIRLEKEKAKKLLEI